MSGDKKNQQQNNHRSNQLNRNQGSSGSNHANSKVNGNRGKQLNPNQR